MCYAEDLCFGQRKRDMMLKWKLVYSGITRGKSLVVLVGRKRALAMAVNGRGCGTALGATEKRLVTTGR